MAQPSSFMLQHNNISQVNNNYYNLNINTKYLGYKYKFVNLFNTIIRLVLLKKTNLKIKILGLLLYKKIKKLRKPFKKRSFRSKFQRKIFLGLWNNIVKKSQLYASKWNKFKFKFIFRLYFTKKLLPKFKIRRKRKFYWKVKKKNLYYIKKYKYKFGFSILRMLKIKNFTYLFFFLKKIKKKKYKKKGRWKMSQPYFLKRKSLKQNAIKWNTFA